MNSPQSQHMGAWLTATGTAILSLLVLSGCDSDRLEQFATFAAAGSQYVQNFHQMTTGAGTAQIATDSAVLLTARNQAGAAFFDNTAEYRTDVQTEDAQLEQYLTTLQKLDAQATLLGSYFAAVTALTNGKPNAQAASAANTFLDSLNAFNPEVEKITVAGKSLGTIAGTASNLIVDHFEVAALEDQLKKAAPTIDRALALQQAAVQALSDQINASQGASLMLRESTDVINPYVAHDGVPPDWPTKREAFLRTKVTIQGLSSAQSAVNQLRIAFQQLVQDKKATLDFSTLLSEIGKMTSYTAAVQSSATPPTTAAPKPSK